MARKIEIQITGDADHFQKSLGKASGSADSFGSKLASLGKVAAVGLAALGAGAAVAGVKMISMASDAAEVQSKLEVVFGKALPGLTANIDKFSEATGTSRFAMREQAADMGALLAPMLGSKQGAADMALQFTELATDLGSFNNIPVAEALEKIRAGLVGESEPLRSLGVLLTEASTKEYAYANGIAKRGSVLTEVQKVEARAGQIMKQTALAQGDAIRTSDSLANQWKRLKNGLTDFATSGGMLLAPFATAVVKHMNTALQAVSGFAEKLSQADGMKAKLNIVWEGIQDAGSALGGKIKEAIALVDWNAAWSGATGIAEGLATKIAAVDWSAVGAKIGDGIATGVKNAGQVAQKIAQIINEGFQAVDWSGLGRAAGPGLATALVAAFATLLDPAFWIKNWDLALAVALVAFTGPLGKLATGLLAPLKRLGGDVVLGIVAGIESFAPRLAKVFLDTLMALPGIATKALGALASPIKSGFEKLGALATFVVKVLGVGAAINAIAAGATAIAGQLGAWRNAARGLAIQAVKALIDFFASLPGKVRDNWMRIVPVILGIIPLAAAAAFQVGRALTDGVISGIGDIGGRIFNAAKGGLMSAVGRLKSLADIRSPSGLMAEQIGKPLAEGITLGFTQGSQTSWAAIAPFITKLGGDIISNFILGVSTKAPAFTGKLAEAATNALEAARAVVEGYQVKLGEAFGRLGEYAKRAFEAKVKGMADGIAREFEAKIGGIKAFQASLTPAELQLQQMDAAEQARQRASALTAAQAALSKAETMDAGLEKEAAVAAAKEQIRVAEAANIRVGLEAQAALERTHRDQAAALQITFLEEAKAKELANLEERTQQQGTALATQLTQLQNRLALHPEEYNKIQKKIITLLNSYGVSFKNSGVALGNAFAQGIRNAEAAVRNAARALAQAAANQLQLKSPAKEGPLSTLDKWWKPMGPMLAKQMRSAQIAGGAFRMAGAAVGGGGMSARTPAAALSSGGGTVVNNFHFPNYVGNKRELVDAVRTEVRRVTARNG